MTYSVIAEHLSKQYEIGQLKGDDLFHEALIDWMKHPFKRRGKEKESVWALRDVSFEIPEGEVVGIIGRNGAGKSTLLKILSRITYPTSGRMTVHGRIAALLEVGTGFHGELTGRENIFLNGSILGMSKKDIAKKLDAIIAFAGVEKFIDTPVKRYSSGMFLRLGFAVAAHLDPDILVVDEVLAVGDVEFQKKCLNAMNDLRSGGRTVLFVSHNMSAVENFCSRVIWIDNGTVRQDGDPKEIIHSYIATFAGAPQLSVDLNTRKDRRGNGEVRFTRIDFLDAAGQPLQILRSGDDVTIRLHYYAEKRILRPDLEAGIYTDLGMLITRFSTWINSPVPFLPPGAGYIDLHIDCFRFLPGQYYLSLWMKSLITTGPIYYDVLEHCLQFEVRESDFYENGRGIESYFGTVFFPHEWKLNPETLSENFRDSLPKDPSQLRKVS
jgi:lipopolysaccharide transport system ATP-binding protein